MPREAELVAAAQASLGRAHCPYSDYAVGCALLDEHGNIHVGVNVENAAYPVGTCAEAGAIAAMVVAGGTRIHAAAVAGAKPGTATPCGACRQRLAEFASVDLPVVISGPDGIRLRTTLGELLPHAFGPAALGHGAA